MKLIEVQANWSLDSLKTSKVVNKIIKNFSNVTLTTYDYDLDLEELKYYNIGNTLPLLILQDDYSNELTRLVGKVSYEQLEKAIKDYS